MVPLVFYQCQSSQMFADMKYVPLRPLRRTGTAPAVSLEVHWKSFEWFHLLSMLIIANCNVSELHSCLLIWNMSRHWDRWEGLAPDRKAAPGFIAACDASEVLLQNYYFWSTTSDVLLLKYTILWDTRLNEKGRFPPMCWFGKFSFSIFDLDFVPFLHIMSCCTFFSFL